MQMLRKSSYLLMLGLLSACAYHPVVPYGENLEPLEFGANSRLGLTDARGRFREIFCTVLEAHGRELPDYQPCEQALTRLGVEPSATGRPVNLGASATGLQVLLVPGLGYECIKGWLDYDGSEARDHVKRFGYEIDVVEVEGLSSSRRNAEIIRDFVASLDGGTVSKPIVMIGYSKGTPDILEALVRFPELNQRVSAVVAFSGAVWGSPLADDVSQSQLNLLTRVPRSECDTGDGGALESLRKDTRQAFMEDHELPGGVHYYSVVSFPSPERISIGLRPSYRKIGELEDGRNDSQLIFYDQVIPGSSVLGFSNADHWAMAVPVARQHPFAASTFASQNDFPREAMLEALLRFIDEDLSQP
jgi:hypothetical protein